MNSPRPPGTDQRSAERARPAKDPVTTEYWDATARGELLIQRCPACGHRQHYPRAACTQCGATPEWERASGRGTIHTFTVIRQNHSRPFRDLAPYVVAIVELEEGPRMMGNVTDCPIEDVRIGMPVEVWFDPVAPPDAEDGQADPDLAIPYWRRVEP